MKHAINRTSPKGQPFIGTCFQCGKSGLSIEDAVSDDCPNVRGLPQGEALIEAIEGKPT
jgi:hypothetical protein